MGKPLDLIGVGIGPFNLSLAALLDKNKNISAKFFEQKKEFNWHSEIMFADSDMQTSYLKDLVTPVDPTSPHSFLNYLVQNGLFHTFMNTNRQVVSRREFEMYCQWVTKNLDESLNFDSPVSKVDFDGSHFIITSNGKEFQSKSICVGTGLTPRIPECSRKLISDNFFHAKSPHLKNLNVEGKNVVIIGGGQTGVEIFRNTYKSIWGNAKSLKIITGRSALRPLDESPFTNEFFTPNYVDSFFDIESSKKASIVSSQKLASDGNTPFYLEEIYRELYQLKVVHGISQKIEILPCRRLEKAEMLDDQYLLLFENHFNGSIDEIKADIVILCTGFDNLIPAMLAPLKSYLQFDEEERFVFNKDFSVQWTGPAENKIFALNFSRHCHGISEPQTSLMAWRSSLICNVLHNEMIYPQDHQVPNFMSY